MLSKVFVFIAHDLHKGPFIYIICFYGRINCSSSQIIRGKPVSVRSVTLWYSVFFSYWSDPEKIENIDHIRAMEQSLKESLNRIGIHKVEISLYIFINSDHS